MMIFIYLVTPDFFLPKIYNLPMDIISTKKIVFEDNKPFSPMFEANPLVLIFD